MPNKSSLRPRTLSQYDYVPSISDLETILYVHKTPVRHQGLLLDGKAVKAAPATTRDAAGWYELRMLCSTLPTAIDSRNPCRHSSC